jgi:hypothetical protein
MTNLAEPGSRGVREHQSAFQLVPNGSMSFTALGSAATLLNLKTARALGIEVSQVVRADVVIECDDKK